MDRHIEIIAAWCEVHAVIANKAIWYTDGDYRYADVYDPEEGWCSYSCDTREMWELLTEDC